MKRAFLLAASGIAALLGGSVALVTWSTGEPPAAPVAEPRAVAAEAPAPAVVEPPRVLPPSLRRNAASGGAARTAPKAPAQDPSPTPWASRVVGKTIRKALLATEVQSRLARCVDRDVGFGGGAQPGRTPRAAPPVLVLELETREGEAQIVGAGVRSWGGASPDVVACASDALRGLVVRNARIAGVQRLRMLLPLHPRSDVVASSR